LLEFATACKTAIVCWTLKTVCRSFGTLPILCKSLGSLPSDHARHPRCG
jgi:hypothetical protein